MRLSRRELLVGRLFGADRRASTKVATPRPQRPRAALHRPPGALPELEFLDRCTSCGDCVTACPEKAIVAAGRRHREAAKTPLIDPASAPCRLCEPRHCAVACETGALSTDSPASMGTAVILEHACLPIAASTTCSVCAEQCPVEDALVRVDGRPVVDAERCTGCGVCQYACPAPGGAIVISPRPVGNGTTP